MMELRPLPELTLLDLSVLSLEFGFCFLILHLGLKLFPLPKSENEPREDNLERMT